MTYCSIFNAISHDELIEIYNDYRVSTCSICLDNYYDDSFYHMCEFNDFYTDTEPLEIARSLGNDFDAGADYFKTRPYITSLTTDDVIKIIDENCGDSEEFLDYVLNKVDFYDFDDDDLEEIIADCEAAGLDDWAQEAKENLSYYEEEEEEEEED